MKTLLFLTLAAIASGCTTAGPFVTNISADGKGNIVVEKNMVNFNSFTGVITTGEKPTVQTLRVSGE